MGKYISTAVTFILLSTTAIRASSGWPSTIPAPADQTVATKVQWLWENVIKKTVVSGRGSYNTFFDQLHAAAAMGKFQVCIRWDSHE